MKGETKMRLSVIVICVFFVATCLFNINAQGESLLVPKEESGSTVYENQRVEDTNAETYKEFEPVTVKDPIQPYNRAIFTFNDKFYYYVIKPTYKGYEKVVPKGARVSVGKFFSNIRMPGRFFNCLFQGKLKGSGIEMSRFIVNTTAGMAGFFDPAKSLLRLEKQDEDFGQTLGKHGMGTGAFIEWPFLGPSSLRDTLGIVGDIALDPLTVASFFISPFVTSGVGLYDRINDVSIDKGATYENITKPAVDPYIALQDAYIQNRMKKIKE